MVLDPCWLLLIVDGVGDPCLAGLKDLDHHWLLSGARR